MSETTEFDEEVDDSLTCPECGSEDVEVERTDCVTRYSCNDCPAGIEVERFREVARRAKIKQAVEDSDEKGEDA